MNEPHDRPPAFTPQTGLTPQPDFTAQPEFTAQPGSTGQPALTEQPGVDGSPRRRRLVVGGLLAVLAGLVVMAGITILREPPTFCDRIAALPSITASLDTDGSPGGGLVAYADALDEVAAVEKDRSIAEAARVVADEQRALGVAVDGSATSENVVEKVASLDGEASAAARDRLDDAIEQRCG